MSAKKSGLIGQNMFDHEMITERNFLDLISIEVYRTVIIGL